MVLNDPLANVMSKILNAELIGNRECIVKPVSKVIKKVLEVMKENQYIGDFEEIDDGKGKIIKINLLGRINKCGVIKPRHAIKYDQHEKFEKRYLPAEGVGLIVISTPLGIITQKEAKLKKIGGRLLAYCY